MYPAIYPSRTSDVVKVDVRVGSCQMFTLATFYRKQANISSVNLVLCLLIFWTTNLFLRCLVYIIT